MCQSCNKSFTQSWLLGRHGAIVFYIRCIRGAVRVASNRRLTSRVFLTVVLPLLDGELLMSLNCDAENSSQSDVDGDIFSRFWGRTFENSSGLRNQQNLTCFDHKAWKENFGFWIPNSHFTLIFRRASSILTCCKLTLMHLKVLWQWSWKWSGCWKFYLQRSALLNSCQRIYRQRHAASFVDISPPLPLQRSAAPWTVGGSIGRRGRLLHVARCSSAAALGAICAWPALLPRLKETIPRRQQHVEWHLVIFLKKTSPVF